jgi:colanic acid/amylovoran biosynthesis glycosyltransferase
VKIAYIVGSFPHVSETFIVNQICGIAARGHTVDVFTTCEGETSRVSEVVRRYRLLNRTHRLHPSPNPVRRLFEVLTLLVCFGWRAPTTVARTVNVARYGKAASSLWLLHAALTVIRHGARHYDVIHAQFGNYGSIALRLIETGATSGPVVTSFRGFDATKDLARNSQEYHDLFVRGRLFLVVSDTLARRLVRAGCDPSKVRVHRSGLDLAGLAFEARRHVPDAVLHVLSVGRLVEKKGFRYGIEAVARLIASGRLVRYVIIGEGPMRVELQDLVRSLGLLKHVTFEGWQAHAEVTARMKAADVLMVPSVTATDGDEEGIPNVAKEAMAMGLPVLATDHGGIPELIENGVSGVLVPERDNAALADRLSELIDHPERWASMGEVARRRIESEYDIERLNDELVTLYRIVSGTDDTVRGRAQTASPHGAAS